MSNPIKSIRTLLVLLAIFVSVSSHAELLVTNATVRILPPGTPNTSAYFTIQNTGSEDRFLVSASTNVAQKAELHAHVMTGEVMKMMQQESVKIGAGEQVEFAPGGLHVMLFGLNRPLEDGQSVSIVLTTANGELVSLTAKTVLPGQEHSHHHH